MWLWPGESLRWAIPAGPDVRVRFRFHQPLAWAPGPAQSLVAESAAPPSARREEIRLPAVTGTSDSGWRTGSVRMPASDRGRAFTLRVERAPADPRPVFIADVVADWPRLDRGEPRVIVLFDIDTMRADHLSLYGYDLPTTPAIDRVFRSGLVADRCFSNATWTLPSHASMFTSTLVSRHRVRAPGDRLPSNFPLLAEVLQKGGYATFGVTNGGYVDAEYGFSRGFDRYESSNESVEQEVTRALADLDSAPSSRVFLFLHTFQVHNYAPTRISATELFGSVLPLGAGWLELIRKQLDSGGAPAAERHVWARRRYDAATRRVDDAFASLVRGLERRGLWEDTAVVLASDHGEALFDRPKIAADAPDYFGHPLPQVYDPEIHVPFAVRVPWKRWRGRVAHPVSMLDLAPTILDIAGVAPPATFEGRSLAAPRPSVIFAASPTYDAVAARDALHKIIVRPDFRQMSWEGTGLHDPLPALECFSLEADPGERSPVSCDAPWAAALREAADRYIVSSFPRSLVLKLEGPPGGAPCRVAARGETEPPDERSFALRPQTDARTSGTTRIVRTDLGSSPEWLAFRPRATGGGLSLQLDGCGAVRDTRDRPVSTAEAGWSELLWKTGALPRGNVILSVPPLLEPDRIRAEPLSTALVRRLRALGYLSAGSSSPVPPALPDVGSPVDLPAARAGEIRIRVR
ncbi:MAG TPA: sulfatase [Thermoanaerobaculia bacterium]|nr:sulfatase [Thermoanaerobaculia bacterium]